MIIIISYSYLITTTYYLSKHPTCKKNHLMKSFDSVGAKKNLKPFFFALLFFLPLLNPEYSRFTVQIFPISKNQNKKRIDTNVFVCDFFFKSTRYFNSKNKKITFVTKKN